jgi:hypothetical protein
MADIISSIPDGEFNVDKNKIIEMLEKSSNNRFSKILEDKTREKSAVDTDGKFKQAPEDVIAKSEEKIQQIKQAITEASKIQNIKTEEGESSSEQTESNTYAVDTDTVNYETLTGNNNIAVLKDVFTGKIKISEYLEQTAIRQYKLMDTAMQGDMLLNASGKFFNDLVENTKSATLENLLSIGWKGKSFDATQKVKHEVEERNDDVA